MKVSRSSLHGRVYALTREMLRNFWGSSVFFSETGASNLCTYFRTIVVYFPLLVLWRTLAVVGPPTIILLAPPYFAGMKAALVGWVVFIAAFLLATSLVLRLDAQIDRSIRRRDEGEPEKQPSLLMSWMKAKKDKVCPLIEFTE